MKTRWKLILYSWARQIDRRGKPRLPLAQREKMFWCSCCPPNIARFIASVGGSVYGKDDERVYVHQYMDSEAAFSVSGNTVSIAQETDYPRDGRIRMTVRGLSGRGIALRIPGWCDRFTLRLNGAEVPARIDRGYAYLDLVEDTAAIDLTLAMHPRLYEASPHVHEDAGRVVVQRGPVVYCLEAIDNGPDLRDIALDADGSFELDSDPLFPVPVLRGSGMRRDASEFDTLYRPVGARRIRQSLKFIPISDLQTGASPKCLSGSGNANEGLGQRFRAHARSLAHQRGSLAL